MSRPFVALVLSAVAFPLAAADPEIVVPATTRGDAMIAQYFRQETAALTDDCLAEVQTLADWEARRGEYRRQLFEMLGLDPLPEKTPLEPVVTGVVEHPEFTVEKLHFQSRPGLYVTGNLYVPRNLTGKAPTILYVCGHGRVKKGDVSYGNKTAYQHHGAWFARNGYVCLAIDTLQLGEIEGIHHGTYNHNMWWWNSRGYTSAGCEAWNCIRALDYLETRPEVDPTRIGVTGRSGGGAYSWWIAALDDRIRVAVPVAGITSLHNHVVDGTVEGHCDCMFMVNTYRWDFPLVAALVAPRPLLISNTDKDSIFPLEGVVDVHAKTRRIYRLYNASDKLGLQITEGPHKDTQVLHIHAFQWFNRFLKGDETPIGTVAEKLFEVEQLRVFDELPADQRNTTIQETFTQTAESDLPQSASDWETMTAAWKKQLAEKTFRGWPAQGESQARLAVRPAFDVERDGLRFAAWDFDAQSPIRLRLYTVHRAGMKPAELDLVVLSALDARGWSEFLANMQVGFADELKDETLPAADPDGFAEIRKLCESFKWGLAYVAPRGIGPTAWNQTERKQIQHRRRFQLLGQTLDGMRVWDIRQAAAALREAGFAETDLWLQGERDMAVNVLYAALVTPNVKRVDLWRLPTNHMRGPDYLNVLRVWDIPQAIAAVATNSQVRIYQSDEAGWEYPQKVADRLAWESKQLQIRVVPGEKSP